MLVEGGENGSTIWQKAPEDLAIMFDSSATGPNGLPIGMISGPLKIRINAGGGNIANCIKDIVGAGQNQAHAPIYNTAEHIIGVVTTNGESEVAFIGQQSTDA